MQAPSSVSKSSWRSAALATFAAITCAVPALAESTASLVSPAGTTVTVTMTVTVTTSLGTSSDSDTKVLQTVAFSDARVPEQAPPWSAITLDTLRIDPSDASFHFDLYCFPFLGCQSLDIALTNLFLETTAPTSSTLTATGQASFPAAPFFVTGDYATTGIATTSGVLANAANPNFACRVSALAGNVMKFDQCTLAPVTTVVDPASLPAGVTALTVTLNANLATCTLVGPWVALNPFDLDGDGNVGAADLSILLSQWGGKGEADFDGSGSVDAADLSTLLANWS
jgi:hypothetical protein